MRQTKILNVARRYQLEGTKIAPLLTEKYDRKMAVVKNKNGSSIILKQNYLTKELRSFLEATGNALEWQTVEARRGRREVAGVKVKIVPNKFVTYEEGAVLLILEKDPVLADQKAALIMEYLQKHGIDIARECVLVREGSCQYIRRKAKT